MAAASAAAAANLACSKQAVAVAVAGLCSTCQSVARWGGCIGMFHACDSAERTYVCWTTGCESLWAQSLNPRLCKPMLATRAGMLSGARARVCVIRARRCVTHLFLCQHVVVVALPQRPVLCAAVAEEPVQGTGLLHQPVPCGKACCVARVAGSAQVLGCAPRHVLCGDEGPFVAVQEECLCRTTGGTRSRR